MAPSSSDPTSSATTPFQIVAVGSSAGGLEALRLLLRGLPPIQDTCFVIAQHLSPHHVSLLTTLLARETTLPVVQVDNRAEVLGGVIYVTPPGRNIIYEQNRFILQPTMERGPKPSIDTLLFSLAANVPTRSVAVILSGSGSDGSLGCRQLKSAGGAVIVQDPKTAKYSSMPQAALSATTVDSVLLADQIGSYLNQRGQTAMASPTPHTRSEFDQILERINLSTNIDFRGYKPNTITRRIQQRLVDTRCSSYAAYLRYLDENHEEIQQLAHNCLISVTTFFRDSLAFDSLLAAVKERYKQMVPDPFRVWVPGCATGEEAYTLAIALTHALPHRRVQIFATDLDEAAIAFGRKAIYAAPSMKEVPLEFSAQHFIESAYGFQVDRRIREKVVFARHDLLRDPLFLNIDLVSCRNLLIYLQPHLQEEVIRKFHHALNPGGLLFLGRSENIQSEAFEIVDRRWRIFVNGPMAELERRLPVTRDWGGTDRVATAAGPVEATGSAQLRQILIDNFAPGAVLIDETFRILESFGGVNRYLSVPEGKVTLALPNMLPKAVGAALRPLLQRAARSGNTLRSTSRPFEIAGKLGRLETTVVPMRPVGASRHFVVAFRELPALVKSREVTNEPAADSESQVRELEQELQATRESLQATVEELETSNEELQALNEEMQASNEELQATNEELHASNEELQATNEELLTVNEELEQKSLELAFLIEDLENIENSIDSPLLVADSRGLLRHMNEDARRLLGLTVDQLGGPVIIPNDAGFAAQLAARIQSVISSGQSSEIRQELNSCHYRVRLRPYQGRHKAHTGVVIVFHDVTSLVKINGRLRRSESRLRGTTEWRQATFNAVPTELAVLDAHGKIIEVNDAWRRFAEQNQLSSSKGGVELNYLDICEQSAKRGVLDAARVAEGLRRVLLGSEPHFSMYYRCPSPQEMRWFLCVISPLGNKRPGGALVTHLDVSEHLERDGHLIRQLSVLEATPSAMFVVDSDGRFDWANNAYLHLTGYTLTELVQQPASNLEAPGNTVSITSCLGKARLTGESIPAEVTLRSRNGRTFVAQQTLTPIPVHTGDSTHFLVTLVDITEQKVAQNQMLYIAGHDELTGLLNRKSFLAKLDQAIVRQASADGSVALLFMDLDRFKDTNDAFGHLVGDQILIEAAQRFRQAANGVSALARFGGDEFVLFVEPPLAAEAEVLIEQILLSFSRPFVLDGRPLQVTLSIGVAVFPNDAQSGAELLRNADLAMYRAKADGRRGFRRFDQRLEAEIRDRVLIQRDLARAISLEDLSIALQPQVDLQSGAIIGAEALLRWRHKLGLDIPISKVISIAEECGLILSIGQWVIRESVAELQRWRSSGFDLHLSVNLSPVQFHQQDVFAILMENLQNCGVPPRCLKVEITETVLLHRSARVREVLHALHGAGVGIHLDDFGTGYSSLSYLQHFPIEVVKIDSSFLAGVGQDRHNEAIVDGIIKLAHSLGIRVIAEGVENPTQVDFLNQAACDAVQGYFYSPPLPPGEFLDFLAAYSLRAQTVTA
ncbi:MAG: EAL domain-containing protein [Acidobacteriota bacterium]|jgi:two-component system CheB/CheR fusion protein